MAGPEGDQVYTIETADRPYRLMIEEMQQGAVILTALDNIVVFSNRKIAQILEAPQKTLSGSKFSTFIATDCLEIFRTLMREGSRGHITGDIKLRTLNGNSVPVLASVTAVPGDITTVSVVMTDLSERKRLEAVEASETFSRSIFDQATDGIVVCDPEGQIKQTEDALRLSEEKFAKAFYGNAAAMAITRLRDGGIIEVNEICEKIFGVSHDEVIGRSCGDVVFWKRSTERDQAVLDLKKEWFFSQSGT